MSLQGKTFVLATDLDGTFLGGSSKSKAALYRWIDARREQVGLIYVTGRDPEFVALLTRETSIPAPDYVVGDVGTTIARIVDGQVEPITELEAEIARRWADAGPAVRAALEGVSGLSLQPNDFRFRVSYDMEAGLLDSSAIARIEAMGFDVLISDNKYFDVLPRGVSKGPSLDRLVRYLGLDPTTVLTAGDTMNDLSMLLLGFPAVVVGNAEPSLLAAIPNVPHIYRARSDGAGGIVEAIAEFALHPDITEIGPAL